MAKIKLTNGFPNVGGLGVLLTGWLIEGEVNKEDFLIFPEETSVRIIEVEFGNYQGATTIIITIPHDCEVVFHKFYGKIFEVQSAR